MLSADPELVEPGKEVHARIPQDFIAAANQAAREGVLDVEELTDNIQHVADLARVVLKHGPWSETYPIGVDASWTHAAWFTLSPVRKCGKVADMRGPMGLNAKTSVLPDSNYPESFVLAKGEEYWGWLHPRWRWLFDDEE